MVTYHLVEKKRSVLNMVIAGCGRVVLIGVLIFEIYRNFFSMVHRLVTYLLFLSTTLNPNYRLVETIKHLSAWTNEHQLLTGFDMLNYWRTPIKAVDKPDLVVAHFKENLSWLGDYIPHVGTVYLYCKSQSYCTNGLPEGDWRKNRLIITYLPNEGRESHAYLYHLVNYYHTINKRTVFTMASLNYGIMRKISFLHAFNNESPDRPLYGISKSTLESLGHYSISEKGGIAYSLGDGYSAVTRLTQDGLASPRSLVLWSKKHIGLDLSDHNGMVCQAKHHHGAIFSVMPHQIKSYDINIYKNLLIQNSGQVILEACYYMERLWRLMYCGATNVKTVDSIK
ncbi:MAG: hypothetical protein VXY77_02145 [Pseudomonadota bacterium]|nr:hypothetical protein [Pseudomonadota bacterium]